MSEVIKPGGKLVTLLFPVDKFAGGPPYALDVDDVRTLITSAGFTETFLEAVAAGGRYSESIKPRQGREWVGVWARSQ